MAASATVLPGAGGQDQNFGMVVGRVRGVPRSRAYAALWLALGCVTVISVLSPRVPVAVHEPRLSLALGSVSGVVGLALLQLGLLRFRALRRPIDLYAGLAFGVLALSNVFAVCAPLPVDGGMAVLEDGTYFLLLSRASAAVLFMCGVLTPATCKDRANWPRWYGWCGVAIAVGLALAAAGTLIGHSQSLPRLLDVSASRLLASGQPITDLLRGQSALLVIANLVVAAGLAVSAIGYTAEGRRLRDPHFGALAGGLILLFFAQLNGVLVPANSAEYVASADIFRLVAYTLLLSNVITGTAQDFAAGAAHQERLRLSRELHDGLAQELAVLRLRLGRITDDTTPSDARAHDLEVARCVVESASVEARAAIAALRSDLVPWADFQHALQVFSQEFSLRHALDAHVCTLSYNPSIDSQLQVDVLRLLQEAFSNAARHGRVTRIDAAVTVEGQTLVLQVRDEGVGFDPYQVKYGVGLQSMAERAQRRNGHLMVDSRAGQGTTIQAYLPMGASGRGLQ
jgi:signal transduction histidine kinase